MAKKKTLEELEDEIKSISRKKMHLIVEAQEIDKKIEEISEEYYALSPEHVKVCCFQCAGSQLPGYVPDEQGKNVKCPLCHGMAFLWMKLYKEGD